MDLEQDATEATICTTSYNKNNNNMNGNGKIEELIGNHTAVKDVDDKHMTYYMRTDGNEQKVLSPLKASINSPEYLQKSTGFSDIMTSVKGSVVVLADQNV